MTTLNKPSIEVSQSDFMRLSEIVRIGKRRGLMVADLLFNELERAWISADADLKCDTVRVGSIVTFVTQAGDSKIVRLVYPGEADLADSRISVLSNVGVALLGLSKGDTVGWITWERVRNSITVVDVRTT